MSGFQSPIHISDAIDRIKKKQYLLPSFQREFIWKPKQIEELFDSIMQNFPTSSMLFWKVEGNTKTDFKFYNFLDTYIERYKVHNDTINTNGINDFHAILDGQQRLTALYIGLCGSYAQHKLYSPWENTERSFPTMHLYLNLSYKYDPEKSNIRYQFKFLYKEDTKEKELYIDKNNEIWFKVSKIMDFGNPYGNNMEDLDDFQEKYELHREYKQTLKILQYSVFNAYNINYYEETEQQPDKAVNIFVRINSGGSPLSFSDILFSIAIASWTKDAKTEINNLVDSIKDKGFDEFNKDYVLKSFLYLYNKDVVFRIQNFNESFIKSIEDKWDSIRDSILSLFDLLKTFGLNGYSLTSYNATLPILYYIHHKNIFKNFANNTAYTEDRIKIKKWLLTILVKRAFSGTSDTALLQSRKAFTIDFKQYEISDDINVFPCDKLNREIKKVIAVGDDVIQSLLETQYNNKFCFSILSLLYPNLDYKNGDFHKDHMHPRSKFEELKKEKYSEKYNWKEYNSIVNLQLLNSNENESKNDKYLDDWVTSETKSYDLKKFNDEHLIPQNTSLKLKDFDTFFEKRKELLIQKLKSILNE